MFMGNERRAYLSSRHYKMYLGAAVVVPIGRHFLKGGNRIGNIDKWI